MARRRLASKSFGVYSLTSNFSFEVFTPTSMRGNVSPARLLPGGGAGASRPRQVKVTRAMGAAMRRIHVGNALSAFGLGFTVPFLYVYVAQVRGLGSMTAGIVLAVFAVAALVVLPFAGRAIVRRGPLPVLLTALVTAAVGALSLGLAGGATTVLLSAAALGAGQAVMQPALATMIVDCSTRRDPFAGVRDAVLPAEPRARRRGSDRRPHRRHQRHGLVHAAVRDRGGDVPGARA